MSEKISEHYDDDYFDWQSEAGEFGGWANQSKFDSYISPDDVVLDFGCGGGYLLKNLDCKKRYGVEINPAAAATARKNGVEIYGAVADIPDDSLDVIISNNALEHTLQPLDELKGLKGKLKVGGKIIFVVPCENISMRYKPNDINHHLYSWSPLALGNLFTEAGYSLIESKAYIHKWPGRAKLYRRIGGRWLFELACRIHGRFSRTWFQVRAVGQRDA